MELVLKSRYFLTYFHLFFENIFFKKNYTNIKNENKILHKSVFVFFKITLVEMFFNTLPNKPKTTLITRTRTRMNKTNQPTLAGAAARPDLKGNPPSTGSWAYNEE